MRIISAFIVVLFRAHHILKSWCRPFGISIAINFISYPPFNTYIYQNIGVMSNLGCGFGCGFILKLCKKRGLGRIKNLVNKAFRGVWKVDCLSGGQVVASSNLAVPTTVNKGSWGFPQEPFWFLVVDDGCGFSFFCVNFPEIESIAFPIAPSSTWR